MSNFIEKLWDKRGRLPTCIESGELFMRGPA